MNPIKKIAIVGIVGVPANYGGFETLVENLIKFHHNNNILASITVYCSSKRYLVKIPNYLSANLKYISINSNGIQSIFYDIFSMLSSVWSKNDVILVLGVSGAIVIPVIRLFSSMRVVVNIEWKREKWRGLSKLFLWISEYVAVRFSHVVIVDNYAIADYVTKKYGVDSHMIAYGGDHAVKVDPIPIPLNIVSVPKFYAISVCRIEPENNIHVILEAFSLINVPLLIVGNWHSSKYGSQLREKYSNSENITMLDPIYDLASLKFFRSNSSLYVHGHSAGGTNPSLVEAMHFKIPILAFDCDYNRSTTEDGALYFRNYQGLISIIQSTDITTLDMVSVKMFEIAQRRYSWNKISGEYFQLLLS